MPKENDAEDRRTEKERSLEREPTDEKTRVPEGRRQQSSRQDREPKEGRKEPVTGRGEAGTRLARGSEGHGDEEQYEVGEPKLDKELSSREEEGRRD